MQLSEMQQKQKYLREQILDKNYNCEDFISFLNIRLNIGDDLTLCTIDQLMAVVKEFVQLKNKQSLISIIQNEEPFQQIIETKQIQKQDRKIMFIKFAPQIMQAQYEKSHKCRVIKNKYSQKKQISCEVSNPVRKNVGGVFGIGQTSFLQFTVTTYGLGWSVGRRYSDFIWLRNYLLRMYPSHIIPPIPNKKASKRLQRHLQKRMRILEYFLNDIVNIPQFLNNPFVQNFLMLQNITLFQNLKRQSQKQKSFIEIHHYQNKQGIVFSKLTEQNKAFIDQMEMFIPKAQKTYKQITRSSKHLQDLQTQQVNTLYEMGNHFSQLHQSARSLLNRIPAHEGMLKLNDIYITLNNMMIQWGNILLNQHTLLQKNFNTFFKYIRNELHGHTQLFKRIDVMEEQFVKYKNSLGKKEKSFNLLDPTKWQLPSFKDERNSFRQSIPIKPQQSKQLDTMRQQLYFYINNYYQNGSKNLERSATRYGENFKQFAIKVKVNIQQLGEMWSQMSLSFSNCNSKQRKLKSTPVISNAEEEIIDY